MKVENSRQDFSGPQENPDDCGTPILCMFYGLLLGILALTIYTTIKVMVLTKLFMVTTHNKHDIMKNFVLSQLPHADQPILVTGHNGVDDGFDWPCSRSPGTLPGLLFALSWFGVPSALSASSSRRCTFVLLVLERSVIKGKQCCDNACEKYTNLPHIKEFYVLFIGNQLAERKGVHVLGLIDFWGPIQITPCS